MAKSKELWRTLRVGDKVRITEIPAEFLTPGYTIFPETMRAYKRLIARRRPLRIARIDEWGLPWVDFQFQLKDGRWEYHSLAINHDGLVKVQAKRPRGSK